MSDFTQGRSQYDFREVPNLVSVTDVSSREQLYKLLGWDQNKGYSTDTLSTASMNGHVQ